MHKLSLTSFAVLLLLLSACRCSVKEKVNKVGEKAGEIAGEAVQGVTSGVENAFRVDINLSEALQKQGISLGKVLLSHDKDAVDNVMSVYMIFDRDFTGEVMIKVADGKNLEMGRAKMQLSAKAGEAKYFDFHFDHRTNIDRDSKIVME
jgi:hypothetical protein